MRERVQVELNDNFLKGEELKHLESIPNLTDLRLAQNKVETMDSLKQLVSYWSCANCAECVQETAYFGCGGQPSLRRRGLQQRRRL